MARNTLIERRNKALAALDAAKAQLAKIEANAAERVGRMAVKAGLVDLDISDEQLAKEFDAIASKFRAGEKRQKVGGPGEAGES